MNTKKESILEIIFFSLSPLFFILYALNVFTRGDSVARTMFYFHICVYSIIIYIYFKKSKKLKKLCDEPLLRFNTIKPLSTLISTIIGVSGLVITVFLSYKYPTASPNASLFHGVYLYLLVEMRFSGIYRTGIFYNKNFYSKDKILEYTLSDKKLKFNVITSFDYNSTVKIKLSKQHLKNVGVILENYI